MDNWFKMLFLKRTQEEEEFLSNLREMETLKVDKEGDISVDAREVKLKQENQD